MHGYYTRGRLMPSRTALCGHSGGVAVRDGHGESVECASALHATLMAENFGAGIPLTAVSGSFKSSLQTKAERCFREYHPRQWVDRSSPAYRRRTSAASGNTTHGSEWIVQVQPTDEGRALLPGIPPTAVGGSLKSSLNRGAPEVPFCLSSWQRAGRKITKSEGRPPPL